MRWPLEGVLAVTRYRRGQFVMVLSDAGTLTLAGIPDGEAVEIFEDYGQPHVNVMRKNGQLRTVLRTCLTLVK